jgi:hypothetical protein
VNDLRQAAKLLMHPFMLKDAESVVSLVNYVSSKLRYSVGVCNK